MDAVSPRSHRDRVYLLQGFFTFNFSIYSYFGQLFVCVCKPMAGALILSTVFIGICNLFSGLIVRPQFMIGTFYAFVYYISPGHWVYQGMIVAVFQGNTDPVLATDGSNFNAFLIGQGICSDGESPCYGTAQDYVDYFFAGNFTVKGDPWVLWLPVAVLTFVLVMSRVCTWLALKYIRFG